MAVSVSSLLAPVLKKKVEGIEDIAHRIANGKAPPPEEIVAVLERTRCDESDLQQAVDRHDRRASLLATIKAATPLRKKLAEIDATFEKAQAEFDRVREHLAQLRAAQELERADLRMRVQTADQAEKALLDYDNLPPDVAERLRDVRDRASFANDAIGNTRHEVAARQRRLDDAVEQEARCADEKKWNADNASFVDAHDRAKNITATAKAKLAEAEKAAVEAEKTLKAVRNEREQVEQEVRKQFGAA